MLSSSDLAGLILKCAFVFSGHSTNFVVAVYVPTGLPSNFWIVKGRSLLCQLND